MGFLDSLLGRTKPVAPNLDALFSIPNAAVTLQTTLGLQPTGVGSVCFQSATGPAFVALSTEVVELVGAGDSATTVSTTEDGFGYTWMTVSGDAQDVSGLCTNLHAINSTLEREGFAHGLLCTMVGFRDPAGRSVGLVYLYKQGSFYPFVPVPGQRSRDNLLELQVRDALASELGMEKNLQRWLALWDAPGL